MPAEKQTLSPSVALRRPRSHRVLPKTQLLLATYVCAAQTQARRWAQKLLLLEGRKNVQDSLLTFGNSFGLMDCVNCMIDVNRHPFWRGGTLSCRPKGPRLASGFDPELKCHSKKGQCFCYQVRAPGDRRRSRKKTNSNVGGKRMKAKPLIISFCVQGECCQTYCSHFPQGIFFSLPWGQVLNFRNSTSPVDRKEHSGLAQVVSCS